MKKLLVVMAVAIISAMHGFSQVPMYFKSGTGTSGNTIPMNQASQKTQLLYTPTDFSTLPISGYITKIYFKNSAAGAAATYTDFQVNFKQNTDPSFPSTSYYAGFTPALAAASFSVTGNAVAGGWYEIPLPAPYFSYNNAQTLIVEIQYSAKTGGLSSPTTTSVGNKRCSGQVQTATTGTTNTTWNDFGMDVVSAGPCTSPPIAGTATSSAAGTVCGGANVTLNLTGSSSGSGQTYQWQSSLTSTGGYTNLGSASAGTSMTIVATGTRYYRSFTTCSSVSDTSAPVLVSVNNGLPAGNYTINNGAPASASNFQSFASALSAMSCGILGPVTFNVVAGSGPYNEQVIITPIAGSSPTNKVTFNGNGCVLTYGATVSAERGTLKLNGADNITVNNLKIIATGATYGIGVHMLNDANNNVINGCNIFTDTTATGTGFAGIAISGSATSATTAGSDCDSITLSNNTINGGYYAITLLGDGTTTRNIQNKITGNTITNFYYYGIYLNGNDGILVEKNDLSRATRSNLSVFYGIYLTTGCLGSKISKNKLHNTSGGESTNTSAQYGLYSSADGTTASPNVFSNNVLYDFNGAGLIYGIYKSGADYNSFYHNTISLDYIAPAPVSTVVYGYFQTAVHTGLAFKNNIISVGRNSTGNRYAVYVTTATATFTGNNNDYYISGTSGTSGVGYYAGAPATTIAAWRTATGQDANSDTTDPVYAAPAAGNFLPTASAINNLGTPVGITTDILGSNRSLTAPDLGAYEFTPCAPITGLSANGVAGTSAVIIWNAVTGAAGYEYVLDQIAANPVGAGVVITATSYNPTALSPLTTYYIHVRTNCGASFSPWVTISFTTLCVNPTAVVTAGGPTSVCSGNSVKLSANRASGITYQWKKDGVDIVGATDSTFYATTSGNYTVVTSIGTCNNTSSITAITINANPDTTVTMVPINGTICAGSSAALNAAVANGATYQWYLNGVAIPAATTAAYTATLAGDYRVQITNATSCSDTSGIHTVTVNAAPVINLTPSTATEICAGGSVLLTAGGATTYSWSPATGLSATTGATVIANPPATTTYTITGDDGSGCLGTTTKTVTVNALPTMDVTPVLPAAVCAGSSVTLTANGAMTFSWSPAMGLNATTGATVTATPASTITYTVTGTSVNGCTNTATKTVTVNALPTMNIFPTGAAGICTGASIGLTATGAANYSWSPAGSLSAATGGTVTATPSTTTTYTIVGTTAAGCQASTIKTVTVSAPPNLAIVPATAVALCSGSSVALTATGATTYIWSPTIGLSSINSATTNASPTATITYTVTGTTDGCAATATKTVTVNPLPTAVITASGATGLCQGNAVLLTATTGTGYTYVWRTNGGANGVTTSTFTATTSGTYDVIISNGSCTKISNAIPVTISTAPPVSVTANGPITFCQGSNVILSAATDPAYTYQWQQNGIDIPGANAANFAATTAGDYRVVVTNVSCTVTSGITTVSVNANPPAGITAQGATTFCLGSAVTLVANAGFTYQWAKNNNNIPGATGITYVATTSGNYSAKVTNASGCTTPSPAIAVDVVTAPMPDISVIYNSTLVTGAYLSYQWYLNGVAIPGATSRDYIATQSGSYTVEVTIVPGCTKISLPIVIKGLGVNTVGGTNVSFYPNPAATTITIVAGKAVNISLSDLDGRKVLCKDNAKTLDIEAIADGVYMLRITDKEGQLLKVERLIKTTR